MKSGLIIKLFLMIEAFDQFIVYTLIERFRKLAPIIDREIALKREE